MSLRREKENPKLSCSSLKGRTMRTGNNYKWNSVTDKTQQRIPYVLCMGHQERQLSFACCFIIFPPVNFASWSLYYRFCLPRKEAEPTVTGCWLATGLDIGKGFILFSLLKKKIKTIHKNHHRGNKKMERSKDKGREALVSRRLSMQSSAHYKLFSALLFVENAKCAHITLKSIAGLFGPKGL